MEGDCQKDVYRRVVSAYFYPRPPGGGRLDPQIVKTAFNAFLSTPSGWRATLLHGPGCPEYLISIHALRVEGDRVLILFYSVQVTISIHALRVEGDMDLWAAVLRLMISIHALRVEGDPLSVSSRYRGRISIHALRVEGDI